MRRMLQLVRCVVTLVLFIGVCRPGSAAAISPRVTDDAYIASASPTKNRGYAGELVIAGTGRRTRASLLRFDLTVGQSTSPASVIPPGISGADVERAIVTLFVAYVDAPGTVEIVPITSAWTESTVTWASQPTIGPTPHFSAVSVPISQSDSKTWKTIDITELVRDWLDATQPTPNNGLAIIPSDSTIIVGLDSKENSATSHAPALEMVLMTKGEPGPQGAPGPQGPPGPQGLPGPNGEKGSQGSMGDPGLTGPQGPKGDTGSQGLQGSAGPVGPSGVSGPAGPQGLKGDTGSTGSQGPQGPKGNTGDPGPPVAGFGFREAWNNTTAYVANNIVTSGGSTWIALVNNVNIAPGTDATKWMLFAAKGDAGDQGIQGAQGPSGPSGSPGSTGATGPQGAQGIPGPQGPAGSTGPQGPQGPAGANGANGAPGPQGPAGSQGLQGSTGSQGPQGATGPVGMTFRDAWASGTSYAPNDAVTFGGESWIAIAASAGVQPGTDPAKWSLLATKGSDGATGPAGSQGPQGPSGPAGPTGTTGPAGSQGPQGLTGSQGPQGSEGSAGPQGIQGPAGQTGAAGQQGTTGVQGPVGMVFQDAWSNVTSYNPTDVATYQGETWFTLLANTNVTPGSDATKWAKLAAKGTDGATGSAGPQGLQGLQGIQGPTGTTGAAGATGPQGLTGPQGPTGSTGATGPQGAQGVPGPQGPAGSTGPQGPQGPVGPEGLQGPQGTTGLTGPQGPAGAAGAGSIVAGSTGTTNLSNTGIQYLAFGVFVAPAATESRQAIVLPNRACTAQKLMVRLSSGPGTGTSRIFTVRTSADGFTAFADTALTCTIADLAFSCDSGATQVSLAAGAGITVSSNVTGSPTLVTAKYAFECLP